MKMQQCPPSLTLLLFTLVYRASCQFSVFPTNPTITIEGQSTTLSCAYINASNIQWLTDGVAISNEGGYMVTENDQGLSNLTIQSVDRLTHNVSFSCVGTLEDNTTQSYQFQLIVHYIESTVGLTQTLDQCSGDTVYVGSTVTLRCSPHGVPPPTVEWLFNESPVTSSNIDLSEENHVITVAGIQGSQSGQWECRASNRAGSTSASLSVPVPVLIEQTASLMYGEKISDTYLVKLGGTADLKCVFEPPLFGNYQGIVLTKDGSGIVSGVNDYIITPLSCHVLLTINPVTASHAGTYRCRSTTLGVSSQTVQVIIATIRQTYVVSMEPSSPLGTGQSVVLTCTPEGSPGNVIERLYWRFTSDQDGMSGIVSADDSRVSIEEDGQQLVIMELGVEHSGRWDCVASHLLTADVVNSLSLIVEAPPTTVVSPRQAVVQLGTPLTLTCSVNTVRTVTFTWRVGGLEYTISSGRVNITNTPTLSTLTLHTVEEVDFGNVSCVASDPIHLPVTALGVLTESSEFYIYGASGQRSVSLELDHPFRLDCDVRGGRDMSTVFWFNGREEIPSRERDDGFTVLSFPNGTSSLIRATARREDNGSDYKCKVEKTGTSSLNQQFNIFVHIPGKIVKFPPAESVAQLGSRFQLDCEATGQPEPVITWRMRGSPIRDLSLSSVSDLGNGSLVFDPVNSSHEGTYVCSIESPSFLVETTMLTVQNPPTPSISLTMIDIVLCVVIVIIAAAILIVSAILAIVCSLKHYRRSKSAGHYDVRQDSPLGLFDRQPSLRDRKDNSGVLSTSPSRDIMDTLQKSPHGMGSTFQYNNNLPSYSVYPEGVQLDPYSNGLSCTSTPLHDTAASTPLHGTVASTSLFSSEEHTSLTGPLPNFPRSNLELSDVMGEGEFGPVVLGVAHHIVPNQDKTLVAVKVLVSQGNEDDGLRPDQALMDFANQMKLSYTNVASILGVCSDMEPYYVIYEYLDMGDLKKFLQESIPEEGDPPSLTPADMRKIILQVADGMAYLFFQRIIHGDLATRNCLISSALEVKIADLGIGHDLYNNDYYDNGAQLLPIRWMPPELLHQLEEGPNFSLHSDIWSFGVLCWEVFAYARQPYESFEDDEVLSMVPGGSRLRPPSASCPHLLYDLMTQCWAEVPERRPQFARLCVAIVDLDFGASEGSQ